MCPRTQSPSHSQLNMYPTTSSSPPVFDYQIPADFRHPWQNQENQVPYQMPVGTDWSVFPNHYPTHNLPVQIELANRTEWQQFDEITNEMMVVNNGRELFPKLECCVRNLNPISCYRVGVRLLRESRNPMKYSRVEPVGWSETRDHGVSRVPAATNEVLTDPKYGSELMMDGVSLEKVKIYNVGSDKKKASAKSKAAAKDGKIKPTLIDNSEKEKSMLRVQTQYKYVPLITVYEIYPDGSAQSVASDSFPETSFIVCTCYKNKKVQSMKSQMNKYVRGDVKRKASCSGSPCSISSSSSSSSSSFNSAASSPQPSFSWTPYPSI